MTILEAAKEWNVKEFTVLNYILKEYIFNLTVENNILNIPKTKKPHIKLCNSNDINKIDKEIYNAFIKNRYVNYKMLGISSDLFIERIKILEKEEKIFSKVEQPTYITNEDFSKSNSWQYKTEIKINPKLNATVQIGLFNVNKN